MKPEKIVIPAPPKPRRPSIPPVRRETPAKHRKPKHKEQYDG